MDKQKHIKKAELIKERIEDILCCFDVWPENQGSIMRLIDDYADAIHAYRLTELSDKIQGM